MLLEPFTLPFVQRGLVEVLLLAVACGVLGTWIVLRGMAFFAHAVGTAAFPGLVLADGLAFSPALGAFGAALLMAGLVAGLGRGRRTGRDSVTALALAAALALGVVLASDVFGSQARVDRLLFGSLLLIDAADLRLAAAAAACVLVASALAGPRWLADGFTGAGDGRRRGGAAADVLLVVLVALVAVAALAAVGALLATALLVVPAATTRLVTERLRAWQLAAVALAAAEGVAGLWLAFQLNAPPGATIAVLGGAVFAAVVAGRWLASRHRRAVLVPAALVVFAALAVAGCGAAGGEDPGGRLRVVATTPLAADLARAVGGDAVRVREILPPNADPHEYEPRPRDVQAVADADIVVTSGLGLDDWSRTLLDDSGSDARVVDLGATVRRPIAAGAGQSGSDPHWWHDPRNVLGAATALERALAAADPPRADVVRRTAAAYRRRVARLDAAIAACVRAVPEAERRIVTDHDALGYLARRYGLTVIGAVIPSQTTRAQASAGDLAALERAIRRERVTAVFPEAAVNADLARRLARDTGASAAHELYGDTLGPPGGAAGTYLGMMAANARELVAGMSGGRRACRIAR